MSDNITMKSLDAEILSDCVLQLTANDSSISANFSEIFNITSGEVRLENVHSWRIPSALQECACYHGNISDTDFAALACAPESRDLVFQIVSWTLYVLLIILAAGGNSILCYVVLSCRHMRTPTNIYIANMAIGDLMMSVLCTPLTFVNVILLRYWPFGAAMCRIVSYLQAVSVFVSAYTLVAISIDRHRAIVKPLSVRSSLSECCRVIGVVWMLAAITCLPIAITSTTLVPDSQYYRVHQLHLCQEVWRGQDGRYYTVLVVLLQFVLPVAALAITYGSIALEIGRQNRAVHVGANESARHIHLARAKRRTIIIMMVVMAVFIGCWLPHHILQIIFDFFDGPLEWPGILYVYTACHWLSMSSCLWNAVIYCIMNANFRCGFASACRDFCDLISCVDNDHTRSTRRSTSRFASSISRTHRRNQAVPSPNPETGIRTTAAILPGSIGSNTRRQTISRLHRVRSEREGSRVVCTLGAALPCQPELNSHTPSCEHIPIDNLNGACPANDISSTTNGCAVTATYV